jgi:hypothetical protein
LDHDAVAVAGESVTLGTINVETLAPALKHVSIEGERKRI